LGRFSKEPFVERLAPVGRPLFYPTIFLLELVPLGREVLLNYPLGAYFFIPSDPPALFSASNLTLGGGRLPFFLGKSTLFFSGYLSLLFEGLFEKLFVDFFLKSSLFVTFSFLSPSSASSALDSSLTHFPSFSSAIFFFLATLSS